MSARCAIAIRPGGPADRAFLLDLGARCAGDSVAPTRHAIPSLVHASYEALLEFVFSEQHVVLVAERDGERLGFALLLTAVPDEVTRLPQGFIAYMAVEPSARRNGIASRLLSAAEEEARRRGLPYMGLMVTDGNAAASGLYDSAGYVTERRLLCKTL